MSEISVSDLESLYTTRIPLATLATRLPANPFTEADHERLSKVLEEYVEAYSEGDGPGAAGSTPPFIWVSEVSRSQWLIRTIAPLWDAAVRYQHLSIRLRGSPEKRREECGQILERCRKRDADAAAAVLEEHLRRSIDLVKMELEDSKDRSRNE